MQQLFVIMAGVAGIEPTLTVLETVALPLNYTPSVGKLLYYYKQSMELMSMIFWRGMEPGGMEPGGMEPRHGTWHVTDLEPGDPA